MPNLATFLSAFLALGSMVGGTVACTTEERPPPTSEAGAAQTGPTGGLSSGSGSGGSGGAGGDGTGGAGAEGGNPSNCFPSTEAMEVVFPDTADVYGPYAVRGTVTLPAGLPAGMTVGTSATVVLRFFVDALNGSVSGTIRSDMIPVDTTEITYEIVNVDNGTVTVGIDVDMDGDGTIDIQEDWRGFYDGTVLDPIQAEFNARIINVIDCVDGIDFGVATCNSLIECQ